MRIFCGYGKSQGIIYDIFTGTTSGKRLNVQLKLFARDGSVVVDGCARGIEIVFKSAVYQFGHFAATIKVFGHAFAPANVTAGTDYERFESARNCSSIDFDKQFQQFTSQIAMYLGGWQGDIIEIPQFLKD